tara:strand:- start:115 stop:387 length:273 start_codon:yes stop_codon:yes gene_type:complete
MKKILNNDTGKFWSFKDTKNYKHQKQKLNSSVIRTFIFDKSFLLEIKYREKIEYVVPIRYTGRFPYGSYVGTGSNNKLIHFSDCDIVKIL